MNILLF